MSIYLILGDQKVLKYNIVYFNIFTKESKIIILKYFAV